MSKLATLRAAAKTSTSPAPGGKQQGTLAATNPLHGKSNPLPDLTNPPTDKPIAQQMTAQTPETKARYFASMAVAPDMPEGTANPQAWFDTLNAQQQAAYRFEMDAANTLDAAEDVQRSPLQWHWDLLAIYTVPATDSRAKDTGLTPDATGNVCLLDLMPVPETKTGNNPAITEKQGTLKSGKVGNVKTDFYDVLARSMKEGQRLRAQIDSLNAGNPETGNAAKVLPEHRSLTNEQRIARLETATKRWTRFRSTVKDAIWVRIQWAAVQTLPLIELDWVYDVSFAADGTIATQEITEGTTPFSISPKGQRATLAKPFSVSNFLKLDVDKARVNGGTFDALMQSVRKGVSTDGSGGPKPAAIPVLTIQTLEQALAEVARFFGDKVQEAALLSLAMKPEGAADGLSDDYKLSIYHAATGLDVLFKFVAPAAQKIEKARLDQAQAERDRLANVRNVQG